MDTEVRVEAKRRTLHIDGDLRVLVIVLLLLGVGMSLVASSSSFFAGGKFDDHFALTRRHTVRCLLALGLMIFAMRVDYRVYRKPAPMFLLLGILLVGGLFVFGQNINETRRWLQLPVINTMLQPADIARLSLVFFLSSWIARKGNDFERFRSGFLPAAIAVCVVAGLIAMTPNYGTASATLVIAVIMMFVGGARILHLAGFVGVGVTAVVGRVLLEPYARQRILGFLNHAGSDGNWQVDQSLMALGSGGMFGIGVGESVQKHSWLPDAYTDFIFSILGEEMGLVGTLIVTTLFLLFILRVLKISRGCNDTFGELLVIGIGSSIFVYSILNMYVVTGLFPVTGLPLPFISYGGTALIVNAFAVGVLLNVAKSRGGQRGRLHAA